MSAVLPHSGISDMMPCLVQDAALPFPPRPQIPEKKRVNQVVDGCMDAWEFIYAASPFRRFVLPVLSVGSCVHSTTTTMVHRDIHRSDDHSASHPRLERHPIEHNVVADFSFHRVFC
jgi:hypothetical protein